MPAGTQASAYQRVRNQAQTALRQLKTEIGNRETELALLREQENALSAFLGKPAKVGAAGLDSRGRIDWGSVLPQLPMQFTPADVHNLKGLSDKRYGDIGAAITRWIQAKLVRRKERGIYVRVG